MKKLAIWLGLVGFTLAVLITLTIAGGVSGSDSEISPSRKTASASRTLPITLPNGEEWTGLTEPPSDTMFRNDHPRILVTPETLPELREKLADPVYVDDVATVRGSNDSTDKAFCYLMWGDDAKGREAIEALLEWRIPSWPAMESRSSDLQGILMYDWLHSLMTNEQRELAQDVILENIAVDEDPIRYFHSRNWDYIGSWKVIAALALDNEWAVSKREDLLSPEYGRFKVYRGALDILTQNALSSGGSWHAGNQSNALSGYESGYTSLGGPLVLRAWETATGQSMFSKTTFFDRLPYDVAMTRRNVQPGFEGRYGPPALEFCTGTTGAESASLARWLIDQVGRRTYFVPLDMLIGDLRVEPKSPDELNLPLYGYMDGGNCVYVRSDWSDDSTNYLFFARHWDRGRYEQSSSHLVISRGEAEPILPLSTQSKTVGSKAYTQLRVWDPGEATTMYQGATYTRSLPSQPNAKRALVPEDTVDPEKPWHRPETLTHLSEENGVVTATTRFEQLLRVETPLAERTVVIDPEKESVVVTDRVELADGLLTESNFGLTEEPTIDGNVIENSVVRITMQSPYEEIVWDPDEYEDDHRGTEWTIGTVKIRPEVVDRKVKAEMLVEVK